MDFAFAQLNSDMLQEEYHVKNYEKVYTQSKLHSHYFACCKYKNCSDDSKATLSALTQHTVLPNYFRIFYYYNKRFIVMTIKLHTATIGDNNAGSTTKK